MQVLTSDGGPGVLGVWLPHQGHLVTTAEWLAAHERGEAAHLRVRPLPGGRGAVTQGLAALGGPELRLISDAPDAGATLHEVVRRLPHFEEEWHQAGERTVRKVNGTHYELADAVDEATGQLVLDAVAVKSKGLFRRGATARTGRS